MFLSPGSRARQRPIKTSVPKNITGAYRLSAADNNLTLNLGGNAFYAVTAGSPLNYSPSFGVTYINTDTGRGKSIVISGMTTFILWPLQTVTLYRTNAGWMTDPASPQRWRLASTTNFNIDPSLGSNSNDGLATGSGALQSIAQGFSNIVKQLDCNNIQPGIILAPGATFLETINQFGQITGTNAFSVTGSSSNPPMWLPGSSTQSVLIQMGDNAEIVFSNITFSATNVSSSVSCSILFGHQWGVADFNNCTFNGGTATTHTDITNDYEFHINFISPTINGIRNNFMSLTNSVCTIGGTVTLQSGFNALQFLAALSGSFIDILGGTTFSGAAFASSCRQYFVGANAEIRNLSGSSIPGSVAGVVSSQGGQYVTAGI